MVALPNTAPVRRCLERVFARSWCICRRAFRIRRGRCAGDLPLSTISSGAREQGRDAHCPSGCATCGGHAGRSWRKRRWWRSPPRRRSAPTKSLTAGAPKRPDPHHTDPSPRPAGARPERWTRGDRGRSKPAPIGHSSRFAGRVHAPPHDQIRALCGIGFSDGPSPVLTRPAPSRSACREPRPTHALLTQP